MRNKTVVVVLVIIFLSLGVSSKVDSSVGYKSRDLMSSAASIGYAYRSHRQNLSDLSTKLIEQSSNLYDLNAELVQKQTNFLYYRITGFNNGMTNWIIGMDNYGVVADKRAVKGPLEEINDLLIDMQKNIDLYSLQEINKMAEAIDAHRKKEAGMKLIKDE